MQVTDVIGSSNGAAADVEDHASSSEDDDDEEDVYPTLLEYRCLYGRADDDDGSSIALKKNVLVTLFCSFVLFYERCFRNSWISFNHIGDADHTGEDVSSANINGSDTAYDDSRLTATTSRDADISGPF